MSGYIHCACRDCFDIAIGDAPELCPDCEKAGCSRESSSGCCRDDAYGAGDESDRELITTEGPPVC